MDTLLIISFDFFDEIRMWEFVDIHIRYNKVFILVVMDFIKDFVWLQVCRCKLG